MPQYTLVSGINRTDTFPIIQTVSVPSYCGTLIFTATSDLTEQMLCELPAINIKMYVGIDDVKYDFEVNLKTFSGDKGTLQQSDFYSIPVIDVPTTVKFKVTPLFDKNAIESHNNTVQNGNVPSFSETNGVVDNSVDSFIWTTPTNTFPIEITFDNSNIVAGGDDSGGGGGSTLIEKTITDNGEYLASDDSADGYSKVTVNVSSPTPQIIGTKFALQLNDFRSNNDYGQMQEIYFYDENQNKINVTMTAKTDIQQLGASQRIVNLVDGNLNTKWTFYRNHESQTDTLKIAYISVDGECKPAYFSYVTGDDASARDPISFDLYYIEEYANGKASSTLILSVENATIPTERKTETQLFPCNYT